MVEVSSVLGQPWQQNKLKRSLSDMKCCLGHGWVEREQESKPIDLIPTEGSKSKFPHREDWLFSKVLLSPPPPTIKLKNSNCRHGEKALKIYFVLELESH